MKNLEIEELIDILNEYDDYNYVVVENNVLYVRGLLDMFKDEIYDFNKKITRKKKEK